ncbi:homeodomain-containing protein [Marinisporobacter balticus]|uniref:Homeodomain-containing protein n=1 Tax=Marinisporobacter balticus TaxID=2018667 RepID=A0A4R2KMZ7_9FIRM|nr:homeodomain-containing protein [Marinisporobacter balticus]
MIYLSDRQKAVELIDEARDGGARLEPACKILGLTSRTYQRWKQYGDIKSDARPYAISPEPKNKLSQQERKEILETVNSKEYASLPPSQIVPKLADKGKYIASESTFYRVLRQNKMLTHRGKESSHIFSNTRKIRCAKFIFKTKSKYGSLPGALPSSDGYAQGKQPYLRRLNVNSKPEDSNKLEK